MTGGIGSGKSEAKKAFRELSVPTIDLDDIAHQNNSKKLFWDTLKLQRILGIYILMEHEEIDRKSLKIDIFNST